jgi:hypothetical protein
MRENINKARRFHKTQPRHNQVTPAGHTECTEIKMGKGHKGGDRFIFNFTVLFHYLGHFFIVGNSHACTNMKNIVIVIVNKVK